MQFICNVYNRQYDFLVIPIIVKKHVQSYNIVKMMID